MHAVFDVLEQLIAEKVLKGYALGGATAAGFHGEPLATRDIDIFVFLDPPVDSLLISLAPLYARLKGLGFTEFEEETLLVHGFPVQFLAAGPGLESEAVTEALLVRWESHCLRVMRPEHLAAIALRTGRPKDRARVVYLLDLPQFDRLEFERILQRHDLRECWAVWAQALGLD
jgi:hypothetical protein